MWLVQMYYKCKHTPDFKDLVLKRNVNHHIDNFYIDYMLKYFTYSELIKYIIQIVSSVSFTVCGY